MKSKGFTLVELIISITLMSFISLVITIFLFRVISFLQGEIPLYAYKCVDILKLNQIIESIFTYIYKAENNHDVFFKGYNKNCSFVSYFNPFENSFGPIVVDIFLDKDCLVLSYFQIYSKSANYINVKNLNSSSKVITLFCNIRDIDFEYIIFDDRLKRFKFLKTLNNKLPDYIKLSIIWNTGRKSFYYFKVMSFDVEKKALTTLLSTESLL